MILDNLSARSVEYAKLVDMIGEQLSGRDTSASMPTAPRTDISRERRTLAFVTLVDVLLVLMALRLHDWEMDGIVIVVVLLGVLNIALVRGQLRKEG
jgi:hypothetical protein